MELIGLALEKVLVNRNMIAGDHHRRDSSHCNLIFQTFCLQVSNAVKLYMRSNLQPSIY